MKSSQHEFRTVIVLSLVLSAVIPAVGGAYSIYFLADWKWVNASILATVEALESFAALSIASLLLIMWRNNKIPSYYIWVSSGLLSIGVFYLLHALFLPGKLFAWLGRMATLIGGFLFTMVWLPDRYSARTRSTYKLPIAVSILSIALGVFSIAFPSLLPTMVTNGDLGNPADIIHLLGGVMFLTAAAFFITRYRAGRRNNDILFFNFCMLNAWADLIFPFSGGSWYACWWFIRLLRLAAYLTIVSFVFTSFQSQEKALIQVNENLQAEVSERRHTEELLKESEEKYRILIDNSQDGVFIIQDFKMRFVNEAFAGMTGYTVEESIGRDFREFVAPEDVDMAADRYRRRQAGEEGLPKEYEAHLLHRDGKTRILVNMNAGLVQYHGRVATIGTVKNITEKKKLEAQLLRAQRMESVGKLAEGVAHDMNNVLSPITLSLEMLKEKFTDSKSHELLDILENSAKRGADLIKQVRSFALGVESEHKTVRVAPLIAEIGQIAKETFPRNIEIETSITDNLWATSGDASQLHQVLMNLCVNARDAMPNGGILEISAKNIFIDEDFAHANIEAKVGPYITISVSDTGTGIPPEVMDRIFEPFFTTKQLGKGTGLGLSTALGIVKSHGGFINVYSEVGKGSTFKVYLPAVQISETQEKEEHCELTSGHGELVLVVEDEEVICKITKSVLETHRYKVLIAHNGAEAIPLYEQNRNEINLVIMDMMLPVMDGLTCIKALREINPSVKVIAVSGLDRSEKLAEEATTTPTQAFLPKPYTSDTLLKIVHEVIQTTT
ncbi:MAG: ATP-binding protein [Thaumarchaeota archaeon]|nr:ATP-binding protein [Nitrososphaerota archaeon]MCL5318160.1 ATP-binding protein [Nitrososphaerota archaeon]